ncbi:MAG TPA: hypothetical protein DCP64_07280 [Sarcina sp.]|nr:hypothetical protein [Sarcina sp.]
MFRICRYHHAYHLKQGLAVRIPLRSCGAGIRLRVYAFMIENAKQTEFIRANPDGTGSGSPPPTKRGR